MRKGQKILFNHCKKKKGQHINHIVLIKLSKIEKKNL